ncbi:hypothetical protein MKX03_013955 [Papaver bracteatum]|nr:hypothetical protein MKX03_013955 [Papaver bracteatum]
MELVPTSGEAETSVSVIEGANFLVEDPINAFDTSREAKTSVWGVEGTNVLIEDRIPTSREAKTLVLFGRVGNGKSALGNSIFGKKEFFSRISASGVTTTCKLSTTTLDDGQLVNVIDTPGLFDSSKGSDSSEFLANEMVKCITLAKDGIDGFILVCSIRTRFSTEEEGVIKSLGEIFGRKIYDYMIVVFTAGDELETTFDEYLSTCPSPLKTVFQLCNNRIVLFDNRTKEETQRKEQVQQLMSYIQKIRAENGQPYKSDVFEKMKKEALDRHEADTQMMQEAQQKQYKPLKITDAEIWTNSDGGSGSHPIGVEKDLRKKLKMAEEMCQQEREEKEKFQRKNARLKNKINALSSHEGCTIL